MEVSDYWWKEGIIYQIYPRSFYDSNQDGIGDLVGIIQKLDYLVDLGIDAIWLSPIYPSPDVDFGYDVSDYRSIDPKFGTLEDFDTLIEEAHRRNIRIIMDMVMNHTSDQHPWFQESRSSRDNPYRDWYIWKDSSPNGGLPNNWSSQFGGSAWEWDPDTAQYYLHLFARQQPDLNWRNPYVRNEMLDIYRFWCNRGVDGFRLDVFNAYFKDDQFRNNPPKLGLRRFDQQKHIHDINQPDMIPFLHELRSLLDSFPARYSVGEVFLDTEDVIGQYCGNNLLHEAFDFKLLHTSWNIDKIRKAILNSQVEMGNTVCPTQVLNNHDSTRTATRYNANENDERLKQAAALLLTLQGTPFMYYGEEIGMRDIPIKRKEIQDPAGKYYWPFFKGRDGCRAPMQWNATNFAGFSQIKPWLPVNVDYATRNIEEQSSNPDSLLNFYKSLISLRRQHPALRRGDFTNILTNQSSIFLYQRQTEDEKILVIINFDNIPVKISIGNEGTNERWDLLLSNKREVDNWSTSNDINIMAEEVMILG